LIILFWSLLAAYIAGSSSILARFINIPTPIISILYCVVFGFFILFKTVTLDYVNRFLMIIKVLAFGALILIFLPFIDASALLSHDMESFNNMHFIVNKAVPIFFAAFGFHGSIPAIMRYLNGNTKDTFKSLFWGSLIPLVVYIIWQAITLGLLDESFKSDGDVGLFIAALSKAINHEWFSMLMNVFSFMAITTSFLGVGLSIADYLKEECNKHLSSPFIIAPLIFLIPLSFSIFYPQGFIFALGFASIALSLFAVVLPSYLSLKVKTFNKPPILPFQRIYHNRLIVCLLFAIGIAIILIEIIKI
jgi:tyrosine-specific transport protein